MQPIKHKLWHIEMGFLMLLCHIPICVAEPDTKTIPAQINEANAQYNNPVKERAYKEDFIPSNYIAIAFHKPNYILPIYTTASPYNAVYANHTPNHEQIKNSEVKYQVSFKTPLLKNIYDYDSSLYFAYTILTYWQVYNKKPFIRETNYEPEFFLRNALVYPLYQCWNLDFFNFGYAHQSNGWGNRLERSWDRLYVEAITSINHWLVSLKPWYIIATYNNDDIANFLGYANLLVAYSFQNQVVSFQLTNLGVAPKRITINLTWSIPMTPYIKAYAELFSGYGQSLIEYNHRTNSAGIGLALNDWI